MVLTRSSIQDMETVLSPYDISSDMSLTEKFEFHVNKLRNNEVDNVVQLRYNLEALTCLSNGQLRAQNIKDECEKIFGEQLWLDVISSTMSGFPDELDLQEAAISCLLGLLEQCPANICQFIGVDQGQYPLLEHVTTALKKHTSVVFQDVCKVISLMAANCEILQQEFITKKVYEAIEIQMSLSDDSTIQFCGYSALAGLARGNMEFKKHLLTVDILNNIVNTLETNPHMPDVQESAVILLATLASDLEVARQQCIIEEIPLILLGVLKLSSHDETLVEVTLEALGVLCSSDGVPDILRKSDGLRLTLAVMKDHSGNTAVQKKGIVLLQLLVTNQTLPENILTLLADVIKEAMTSCCDDADIQSEACVILHLMCENDIELGQKLVRLNIHEHFFKLFENFQENDSVLDVVSQCLYLLACVHDLKNPMLLSMCALGSYKAVECLIHLGANVNCGEGSNTPLCLACSSNNLELVNYLLTQGVADVHSALEFCLESRRHNIAGFLLKHMGHDVEAGTITLTGLNLNALRSEWLEPAFIGNRACLLSISSNQWWEFVERARFSRIVRKRLGSSVTSDDDFGSLESLRKISFQEEDNIFELPPSTPPPILIPRATPSPSERSTDSHDRYHFSSLSTARLRTLTGASIPYSCGDPRLLVTPTHQTTRDIITPESCASEEKSFIDDENTEDSSTLEEKIPKRNISKWNNRSSNLTPSSIPEVPSENSFESQFSAHKTLRKSTSMSQRHSVFIQKNEMRKCRSGSALETFKNQTTEAASPNPVHRLDLSFNRITSVEILAKKSGILSTHLKSIEKLDLSNNKLEYLPSDLGNALPRLKCLTLKHNNFRLIPSCVSSSSSLEWLDLSHNKIAKLEEPKPLISSLVSHLNLSNNSIKEFPVWLGDAFGCLTSVDFSYNLLQTIKNRTTNLRKLKSLNLSNNSLNQIPSHFMEQMVDLEVFKAGYNELQYLPDDVAPHLVKLATVKVPNNKLNKKQPFHCTKFLLLLPNVHTVNLSDNNLCSVASPSNWTSQNLKDLNLSHNRITYLDLSKGVSRWSFMNRLDLSYNQLKQVPKGIGQLKNLGQLNLSGNNGISILPDEMGNLGRLYELLHSDMRLAMNASLLRGRTRDLVAHLQAKLRNSAPCPQRKLVVVGPRGSGKSALLRLLTANKALKKVSVNDRRKTKISDNLQIQKWFIPDVRADCRCCSSKNVHLTLRVWEFPGASTSVAVHRCFLTESDLHLLVYNVSAGSGEIENLKPWLANIYDQCQNAGVLLVGTHLDKVPVSQQKTLLKQVSEQVRRIHAATGYPEVRGHFVVNCLKTDKRVEEFTRRLLNNAMALNTKGYDIQDHRVPRSFIKLQEILEAKINDIKDPMGVVNMEFITECASQSKLDVNKEICNEAVAFLRQSGLLVSFSKPLSGLNELFFLWPAKLASLIAHVVQLFESSDKDNGLIEREELVSIIVKEGCPESISQQILRLLEHFEIVLPVAQYTYLVISGLPREPSAKLTRTAAVCYLRRRYIMSYMPVGFWARLVVYLLHQSEELIDVQQQTITEQHQTVSCTFWRNGFSAHWSNDCNFSIEKLASTLEIVVPSNIHGHILLGNLVYHIDALIQEWFPALCGVDALNGSPMIRKTTFCLTCQEHQFLLEDCAIKARSESFIKCPKDNDDKLLRAQVPDVMLSHIDQRYLIKKNELKYYESQETMLGEGSFGSVYKAKYKEKVVAAKVFKPQTDFESGLEYLEQEVRFLARLRHPSIIDLIGMCLRPVPIAVLELAPLGSLSAIFRRNQTLSRGIQHRIAMQVAEGLAFLHNHAIVYRDLKPHNILIFSLAAGTLINAKISDFGSCRHAMPFGFIARDGTPGYRAPEVARGDVEYNEKADIFSLGMLLYELATGGKQPFENLKFRSELDEAVINGRPVDPIIMADSPPWPDMQDLLDNMLILNPDKRPTAKQVYKRLSGPEFISLKNDIAVCKGQAVECMAVRCYSEEQRCRMEVWVGSGASDWSDLKKEDGNNGVVNTHTSQLSRFDLSSSKPKGCKGTILQDGRILAILCVGENLILVGTQTGNLWVYDAGKGGVCYAMPRLPDAVLCLRHSCVEQRDLVFAGLADGKLAVYKTIDFYNNPPPQTTQIIVIDTDLCCHYLPLLSMTIARKKLYCATGHNVVSIRLDNPDLIPGGSWSINEEASDHKGVVSIIIVDKKGLWCCMKGSSRIQLWDLKTHELRARFNCEDLVSCQQSTRGLRVVSILIHNNVLWIGTGGGQILLVDTNSMSLLMTMTRHRSAVRCLTTAVLKEGGKPISMVLSGGLGFIARESSSSRAAGTSDFGYVLVWDSGIHEESQELQEYKTRRNEWLINNTNR